MAFRNWRHTLNRIDFLVENPCGATWDVYVETAIPAAGEMVLVLLTPTPEEIVEEFLHPAYKKKDSKRRKGKSAQRRRTRPRIGSGAIGQKAAQFGRFFRKALPDVDEQIAKRVPGRAFFGKRTAIAGEQWIWQGIDILDRFAFWWLLLDVTEDFIYTWSSGIMESRFCSEAYGVMYKGYFFQQGTTAFRGLAENNMVDESTVNMDFVNTLLGYNGPGRANVYILWTQNCKQDSFNDNEIRLNIITGGEVVASTAFEEIEKEGFKKLAIEAYVEDIQNLRFELEADKSGASFAEPGILSVFGWQAP